MKKTLILLLIVSLVSSFAGCGGKSNTGNNGTSTTPPATTTSPGATDVKTTASIVDNEAAFKNAISSKGTWIIATLKDLTFTEDLVLDGNFVNGKKDEAGKDIVQRKIALYTQDENRNVTGRFTLTAPKLTIKSPMASIQHGIFKGDLYVDQDNFQLVDQKVDGNVYFTTDSAKSTFKMDATSSITGKQEVKKP
jgi:predicted small lipoprotein YifL